MEKTNYKDEVRKGHAFCGFCSTKDHDSCKGGYRNGDGSVLICGCECADSKPEFCHHCKSKSPDDLGRPWLCDDRDACEGRLRTRLENEWAWVQKRSYEAHLQNEKIMRIGSPRRSAICLCCGEATKGGKFLPGHDSKWLNQKIDGLEGPWMPVYDEIAKVASQALAEKFKKRVYG